MAGTPFAVIPEWLLHSGASSAAKVLYGILARHADNNGHGAYPSHARLARLSSLSVRTVRYKLAELVSIGAIEQKARYGSKGERRSNRYRLLRGVPIEQLSLLVEEEKRRSGKPPELRRPEPMWQALEEMFGAPPKAARYRASWGIAVTELREQHATPAQIRKRVLEGRQTKDFQWAVSTPAALAKHWSLPIGADELSTRARGRAWAEELAERRQS
jgi:hypothetical protein